MPYFGPTEATLAIICITHQYFSEQPGTTGAFKRGLLGTRCLEQGTESCDKETRVSCIFVSATFFEQ